MHMFFSLFKCKVDVPGYGLTVCGGLGGKEATGRWCHSGEFVLSSVGTSHQWVAGYGNATLLLYSQMVNKMQTQMSLHIGHSPMSEPILLYINTLPALKQLIQTEPHKQVARTILLYTTTRVERTPKYPGNAGFVCRCTLPENFRPSVLPQEGAPTSE